jgi:PBP1b-binding outer membrane lipoprotein LpoB
MQFRVKILSTLLIAGIFFTGCATTVKESEVALPEQKIVSNTNQYSVPLQKLGDMLYTVGDEDIYIALGDITNKTLNLGKVPNDITGMLKTAFVNIGYKVHVLYNNDMVSTLAQQNKEVYIVEGEISEYEQVKGSGDGFNLGLSVSSGDQSGDMDYSDESGTKVFNLSLDLRVIDGRTGEYKPFVFAKNKIRLVQRNKSRSISFFIVGNGFGMSGNYSKQNGMFSSLRLLSELSSIEIVGKLRSLPYWLVLPNGKPNYNVINNFKRHFKYYSQDTKKKYIGFLLRYYYPNLNSNNFNQYVKNIKSKLGIYPPDDRLTPELFAQLLINATKHSLKSEISNKRKNLLESVVR